MGKMIDKKLVYKNDEVWTSCYDGLQEYLIEGNWLEDEIPKFFSGVDLAKTTDYCAFCNEGTANKLMQRYLADKEDEFMDNIIRRFNCEHRDYKRNA